ncbi:hypothetical protein DSAG12_00226 [Promethearchaeum syntrophicum]|uniref:SHSP domain-containing protein n=1 Tax=Promethearchaeum syntrophicum TaxID=2594042 RepID=A0A5B9D604_9ARCH|nr:hypothetical protein [Candidatus Prometheoarchaeum syntrophicum]QEE14413.1 hypothetical protein DSAG12_00226 [Candidatus Prometheoarchaeum syntrophicum]
MDIFEKFDRRMKRMWDLFDDEREDFFESFKGPENISDKGNSTHCSTFSQEFGNSDGKNYSMTYKYNTGMKEPEIDIRGNPTQDQIDTFLDGLKNHHRTVITDKKYKALTAKESDLEKKEYSLEMPGLSKEDLTYKIEGKNIILKGEKNDLKYNKVLRAPFKVKDIEIIADNGLFTIITKKK